MNRLTWRNNDGVAMWKCGENCGYRPSMMGEVTAERLDRLAAYEDSGFEPETFAEMAETMNVLNERFKPFVEADDRGQLQILPCAIGDHVFRVDTFPNGVKELPAYPEYIVYEVRIGMNTEMKIYAHRIVNGGIVATSYEVFEEKDFGTVLFPSLEDAREACEDANKGKS